MPPTNDDFANAIDLTGTSGSMVFSNVGCTTEVGEFINGDGPSVWFKITPSTNRTISVFTSQTPLPTWDSYLSAFVGSRVSAVGSVARDDDGDLQPGSTEPFGTSRITWNATAGVTYHIQVTYYDDVSGPPQRNDLVLGWLVTAPAPTITSLFNTIRGGSTVHGFHDNTTWTGLRVPNNVSVGDDVGLPGDLIKITGTALLSTASLRVAQIDTDLVTLPFKETTGWTIISDTEIDWVLPVDSTYCEVRAYDASGNSGNITSRRTFLVLDPNPGPWKPGIDNGREKVMSGIRKLTSTTNSAWSGTIWQTVTSTLGTTVAAYPAGGSSESIWPTAQYETISGAMHQLVDYSATAIFDVRNFLHNFLSLIKPLGESAPNNSCIIWDTVTNNAATAVLNHPNDPEVFSNTTGRGIPVVFEYDPNDEPQLHDRPYPVYLDGEAIFTNIWDANLYVQDLHNNLDPDPGGTARDQLAHTTFQYTRMDTSGVDLVNQALNNSYLAPSGVDPYFSIKVFWGSEGSTTQAQGIANTWTWQQLGTVGSYGQRWIAVANPPTSAFFQGRVANNSYPGPDGLYPGGGLFSIRISDFDSRGLMAFNVTQNYFGHPILPNNGTADDLEAFISGTGRGQNLALTFYFRYQGPRYRYYYTRYANAAEASLRLSQRDDGKDVPGGTVRIPVTNVGNSNQDSATGRIGGTNTYW